MSIEQQSNNQCDESTNLQISAPEVRHSEHQVAYQSMGTGKNLVLVHGWGVNSAIWQLTAEQLSQHYCVHLVDLPGFGKEPEISDYSLANISDTILRKLPDNAIWCGWSLGGLIATYVARHHPARVEKLIQVCAAIKFVEQAQWLGVKRAVFERFKTGVVTQPEKTLNRFLSLQAMGSVTVKNDIAIIKGLLAEQPQPKQDALVAGLDLLSNVDLRESFSQLTMPCLSLFGRLDSLVTIANMPELIKLYPANQQVIFEHSSHAPFISESVHFQRVVIDFIEG